MKNNPIYIAVKTYALANSTIEQAETLTRAQVSKIIGEDANLPGTFLLNMRTALVMALTDRDDIINMNSLKQNAKTWLNSHFPNWKAERGREHDMPFVKIWLKGKP